MLGFCLGCAWVMLGSVVPSCLGLGGAFYFSTNLSRYPFLVRKIMCAMRIELNNKGASIPLPEG